MARQQLSVASRRELAGAREDRERGLAIAADARARADAIAEREIARGVSVGSIAGVLGITRQALEDRRSRRPRAAGEGEVRPSSPPVQ